MKKIKHFLIILVLFMSMLTWLSCKKEWSAGPLIETSKPELKVGDSIGVNIHNQVSGSLAKWKVQPSTGVAMDSVYTKRGNVLYFSQAGSYTIQAEMRTIHMDCRPSPSWDTCFNRAPTGQILTKIIIVKN